MAQQKEQGLQRKRKLIESNGSACSRCGFTGSLAALSFHHVHRKVFDLNRHYLGRKRPADVAEEAEKCVLLCVNCHHEMHNPTMMMDSVAALAVNFVKPSIASQTCIVCDCNLSNGSRQYCSVRCKNAYHQNYQMQQTRGLLRKLEYVRNRGGACSHCGYNANLAALVFHHTEDKKFALDLRSLANRREAKLNAEVEKCVLLCANCHMTLHHPQR